VLGSLDAAATSRRFYGCWTLSEWAECSHRPRFLNSIVSILAAFSGHDGGFERPAKSADGTCKFVIVKKRVITMCRSRFPCGIRNGFLYVFEKDGDLPGGIQKVNTLEDSLRDSHEKLPIIEMECVKGIVPQRSHFMKRSPISAPLAGSKSCPFRICTAFPFVFPAVTLISCTQKLIYCSV
jgi:hypothetical protein